VTVALASEAVLFSFLVILAAVAARNVIRLVVVDILQNHMLSNLYIFKLIGICALWYTPHENLL